MSYDQTKLIAYAEMADNIFGYFAVLNAGTSTNKTLHAVRELIEDEARQTQHVTE